MKLFIAMIASTMMFASFSHAAETMGEKTEATGNKIKRSAKKGVNRVKEAVCMKGDLECAAEKAKHRVEEGKDTVVDKAGEVKNNVD